MEFVDYYKIMGLDESASAEVIKRTYRKLARKYHPDVSKEADSENRFKEVGEAYQVLKDPEKRREYDELRRYGSHPGAGFKTPPDWQTRSEYSQGNPFDSRSGDFSDFFEQYFGSRASSGAESGSTRQQQGRGQDVHTELAISLLDAYTGSKVSVELSMPVFQEDGSLLHEHKTLQVKIPAGVVNNQKIRLRGQGAPGLGQMGAGDLYIQLRIQEDNVFHLDGKDINISAPIMPWDAALGGSIEVPTLGGPVNLTIPPNSQAGKVLRLKGRGLPGKSAGDQLVSLTIVAPKAETEEQRVLYESMRSLWSSNQEKTSEQSK
jgi:curved DNA-binding protein